MSARLVCLFGVPLHGNPRRKISAVGKERVSPLMNYSVTFVLIEVLRLAIRVRCDIRAEEPDYITNNFKKAV